MEDRIITLGQSEIPKRWYNVIPDLPEPMAPPIHPGTKQPLTPDDLAPIFPMGLIMQEASGEQWIDIPDEIRKIYRIWRPSPLIRATQLEERLKTPARIYYKNEGVSPPGSHKPNTAVAQAYYNKVEGVERIVTETGAGQWGSALSFACNLFGIKCKVYMVKVSYEQKPYRKSLMHIWGSEVVPSPSMDTQSGRKILEQDPKCHGSLGIAISEAVEDAATHDDTKYSLGSVLNHVLLHQTVVGQEAKEQFKLAGDYPDVVAGCIGGGSNFAGYAFPFVHDKVVEGKEIDIVCVEPLACPTVTRGQYRYDFGDTAQLTPLLKMFTLGHSFVPPPVHAGGLRYHGMAPLVSHLNKIGVMRTVAYHQNEVFDSALMFARTEGIVPAPETAHVVHYAVQKALECKEKNEELCISFNFSGHGYFDLAAYDSYLAGELEDYAYPKEEIEKALAELPPVE